VNRVVRPWALLLAALALALAGCAAQDDEGPGRLASNDDPGYSATGAEVIETGADGQPRYRLRADKVRQDPATGAVALEGVDMTVSTTGPDRWRLQAERGRLPADARRVTLEGDVRLDGEAVPGERGPLRIRTAALDYDMQADRVEAAGEVRFEMAGRTLEATGLQADLASRQAKLNSRVHGRFTP
jgi:LPS export ABC transporter protein LptC